MQSARLLYLTGDKAIEVGLFVHKTSLIILAPETASLFDVWAHLCLYDCPSRRMLPGPQHSGLTATRALFTCSLNRGWKREHGAYGTPVPMKKFHSYDSMKSMLPHCRIWGLSIVKKNYLSGSPVKRNTPLTPIHISTCDNCPNQPCFKPQRQRFTYWYFLPSSTSPTLNLDQPHYNGGLHQVRKAIYSTPLEMPQQLQPFVQHWFIYTDRRTLCSQVGPQIHTTF